MKLKASTSGAMKGFCAPGEPKEDFILYKDQKFFTKEKIISWAYSSTLSKIFLLTTARKLYSYETTTEKLFDF